MVFARVDRLELLIRSSCSLSSLAGSFVCRKVIENSNNYAWLATRHEQEQYEHKEKGRCLVLLIYQKLAQRNRGVRSGWPNQRLGGTRPPS